MHTVALVHPDPFVAISGSTAVFTCTTESVMDVNCMDWIINGIPLNDSQFNNASAGFEPISRTGTLKLTNVSLLDNKTMVQCVVTSSGEKLVSSPSTLLVQGNLGEFHLACASWEVKGSLLHICILRLYTRVDIAKPLSIEPNQCL